MVSYDSIINFQIRGKDTTTQGARRAPYEHSACIQPVPWRHTLQVTVPKHPKTEN